MSNLFLCVGISVLFSPPVARFELFQVDVLESGRSETDLALSSVRSVRGDSRGVSWHRDDRRRYVSFI